MYACMHISDMHTSTPSPYPLHPPPAALTLMYPKYPQVSFLKSTGRPLGPG